MCIHLTQMLVEIPYLVVQVLLYTNIVFWMLGYVITACTMNDCDNCARNHVSMTQPMDSPQRTTFGFSLA